MDTARLVLLPGLDGTGALFARLLQVLPPSPAPMVISYPVDRPLGIEGLAEFVQPRLPRDGPFVVLGESFSGPVAVQLAARRPSGLVALVLVASFLRYPPAVALLWRALVRDALLGVPPPDVLLKALLLGLDASEVLISETRSAVQRVAPEVVAARLRAVLKVDARDDLERVEVPVVYLRGARDRLVGPWAVDQVRAIKPEAGLVTFDAPHLVLQRRPREGAVVLLEITARHRP